MVTLLDHQQYKPTTNNCALYWEMGVGKTYASLNIYNKYYNSPNLLIVCPKSVIAQWEEACYNMGITTPYIINYDLIFRRKIDITNYTLILDESSYVKNYSAKRTKAAKKLATKADHVILLSGTPCAGKYEELVTQVNMLGWKITKSEYWNRYVNFYHNTTLAPIPIPIVTGYKNVNELKDNLAKYGASFIKSEEVINLPEQRHTKLYCDKPKEYNQFVKNKGVNINGIELIGDTTLGEYLGKRQICSIYNNNKKTQLKDLLESNDERMIIFYNYVDEKNIIENIIGKNRPISYINGQLKDLTNYEKYDNSIVLCQYQAGSLGLNLQKARLMVFYSPTDRVEFYEQAPKRIHRVGQKNNCMYYHLITKGTIEEDILKTTQKGKDYNYKLFT